MPEELESSPEENGSGFGHSIMLCDMDFAATLPPTYEKEYQRAFCEEYRKHLPEALASSGAIN